MQKHKDCEHACQQAVEYGVWDQHSCSPECVWLKHDPRSRDDAEQATKDAVGEVVARVVHAYKPKEKE
jgi:hypothetical protein